MLPAVLAHGLISELALLGRLRTLPAVLGLLEDLLGSLVEAGEPDQPQDGDSTDFASDLIASNLLGVPGRLRLRGGVLMAIASCFISESRSANSSTPLATRLVLSALAVGMAWRVTLLERARCLAQACFVMRLVSLQDTKELDVFTSGVELQRSTRAWVT
mmetsp:Transcript_6110/g.11011  ORF Transcript_6110/g.11011 Transcript_6110/m.11011 type:complete len:160 (+) Transcript_6110:278-757(+)